MITLNVDIETNGETLENVLTALMIDCQELDIDPVKGTIKAKVGKISYAVDLTKSIFAYYKVKKFYMMNDYIGDVEETNKAIGDISTDRVSTAAFWREQVKTIDLTKDLSAEIGKFADLIGLGKQYNNIYKNTFVDFILCGFVSKTADVAKIIKISSHENCEKNIEAEYIELQKMFSKICAKDNNFGKSVKFLKCQDTISLVINYLLKNK